MCPEGLGFGHGFHQGSQKLRKCPLRVGEPVRRVGDQERTILNCFFSSSEEAGEEPGESGGKGRGGGWREPITESTNRDGRQQGLGAKRKEKRK
jgi:hypothetical protein